MPYNISFNPRTHTGCDCRNTPCRARSQCFNPRTHTGCDIFSMRCGASFYVSIHAPTRGATLLCAEYHVKDPFQSTHPHGVRLGKGIAVALLPTCFNPRTHTGCDTRGWCSLDMQLRSFNPRTHTGCDPDNISARLYCQRFQSTHPHGVRRPWMMFGRWCIPGFNPRTHTGCDAIGRGLTQPMKMFQSTHPHGVRHFAVNAPPNNGRFQSTHPHGVRHE